LTAEVNGVVTDAYTVPDGDTATTISIVLPAADVNAGVTCGISNAFLDGGTTELVGGVLGFAPTITGTGASETATCTWYAYTGPNTDPPGTTESVAQMNLDCYLTNVVNVSSKLPLLDPDDCAGVTGVPGGAYNDVIFTIVDPVTGGGSADDITANTTGVPEPSSASLLLLGLVGLGFFARRKLLA